MNYQQILTSVRKNRKRIAVGVTVVALILLAVTIFNLARQGYLGGSKPPSTNTTPTNTSTTLRHPLTGAVVTTAVSRPMIYAVMVENSADAWPQSGVDQSFLTFEVPAEGGIPRFLTLFSADQSTVEKIGPVRSARPYFVDLASAYSPLYTHVGGSPDALNLLKTAPVNNFDQFFNGNQFWRSTDRVAPHNVYTSTTLLAEGLSKDYPSAVPSQYGLWNFKDDAPLATRPDDVKNVEINFGAGIYRVDWVYTKETDTYKREEGSHADTVQTGAQLTGNNIVVMETDMQVLDSDGRLQVRTTGSGKAIFAQDGTVTPVTWKRDKVTDVLRFYKDDGSEMSFNAGHTWIEVVASLSQAAY